MKSNLIPMLDAKCLVILLGSLFLLSSSVHSAAAQSQGGDAAVVDDFSRANTTPSLDASSSVGEEWLTGAMAGYNRVISGRLIIGSVNGSRTMLLHRQAWHASENFKLAADCVFIQSNPGAYGGLVFGYQNPDNFFVAITYGSGELFVLRIESGQERVLFREKAFEPEPNTLYRLHFDVADSASVSIGVEEIPSGQHVFAHKLVLRDVLQAGFAGLVANSSHVRFDRFAAESAEAPMTAMKADILSALEAHSANPPRYVNHRLQEAMALALETPVINTSPLPRYSRDTLDYGMAMGLELTPNGRLWATWNPGSDGPEGFVVAATSDDRGETWSELRWVIDNRDPSHPYERSSMHGVLWTDPDGRLWLFFDQAMNKWDGRAGVWYSICNNPDSDSPKWSTPIRIADGFPVRKPIVTSTGEWLLPIAFHHFDVGTFHELDPMRKANVYASTDNGMTWEYRGGVRAPNPHCDEHNLVELTDGRIWMTQRTAEGLFESFSADAGRTWTEPRPSREIAQPTAMHYMGRLKSGNLLLLKNGFQVDRMPPGTRVGMTAFISRDEGATWEGGLVLDERGRVSHPDATQAEDGTIFATNDYERPTAGEVMLHRFREEDVLAGQLITPGSRLGMHIFKPDPDVLRARLEAEARGEVRPKK